jgi:hypothetical protein
MQDDPEHQQPNSPKEEKNLMRIQMKELQKIETTGREASIWFFRYFEVASIHSCYLFQAPVNKVSLPMEHRVQ